VKTANRDDGARSEPIFRNRSFWGLTVSQLLGSFNDNLFKQLVLLLCLDHAMQAAGPSANATTDRYQPIALIMFALPWILFSGTAGFLSDRTSKQRGIVLFKSLEVVVMGCGLFAFLSGELWPLLLTLFFMSTQSAFFGPSKYGILPELFAERDLPRINGIFQMTTFVAIIIGFSSAGILKGLLPGQQGLAIVSVVSIVIAIIGAGAALLIRPTAAAQPALKFGWSTVGVDAQNWRLIGQDRFLLGVLLASALFWFTGAIVQPAVNGLGRFDLGLSDARTSLLQACVSIGIAFGCLLSGRLSKKRIRFGLVRAGAWGIVLGLISLTALVYLPVSHRDVGVDSFSSLLVTADRAEWLARLALIELGLSAGIYIVPLQVTLQTVPPQEQKGRMIGTMNLVNWIGILLSAVSYGLFEWLRGSLRNAELVSLPSATVFSVLAILIAAVAVFYRPGDRDLE
jgi:acyl-[acyl-carrier-protein]-phospholipid O-acyltransferase/long-chain-fatty-acid--[acyl-carrier-protein] ligase